MRRPLPAQRQRPQRYFHSVGATQCIVEYQLLKTEALRQRAFVSELLHGLMTVGLVDQVFVTQANPLQQNEFHSKVQTEAQEHGSELEVRACTP